MGGASLIKKSKNWAACERFLKRVLEDSGMSKNDIHEIVLVPFDQI
mgnify:CR=1 FL=1